MNVDWGESRLGECGQGGMPTGKVLAGECRLGGMPSRKMLTRECGLEYGEKEGRMSSLLTTTNA